MLENSLDPILHTSTLQTIEHTPSHQRLFEERYHQKLQELCERPQQYAVNSYARVREEEKCWPLVCALLDTIAREHASALKLAMSLVQTSCAAWSDQVRHAPQAWLERAFAGQTVLELEVVRHIDLRKRVISLQMLENLCKQPSLSRLSILRIDEAELSTLAGRILANHACLDQLRELYLNHNPELGTRGVSHLLEQGRFEHLEVLSLAGCNIEDEALFKLCQNDSIRHLTYLDLHHNALTDRGVCVLALSSSLANLRHLYLYQNPQLTNRSAQALLHRREIGLPSLLDADLHDCSVQDSALCDKLLAPRAR